ncbi:MAG: uL15 family ribosomal protein, partial [Candidatus Lokiarchaeota archaeon]|nr:uL15 family ribosomal protein [Candidatus Lokiarchaeota archaeon]
RIYQVNTINVKDLDQNIDNFVIDKKATKSGNTYNIDLNNINIQKILARGELNKTINITVNKASKRAIEKVEAAGGKLTILSQAE